MNDITNILIDRIINKKKDFSWFSKKYKISKLEFDNNLKSIQKCIDLYSSNIVIKAYKIFESKVVNDIKIKKWNDDNPGKKPKPCVFTSYCQINEIGKSIKSEEKLELFFNHLNLKYELQSKNILELELEWIQNYEIIKSTDKVCYYCGISEDILDILYNDSNYSCKTKRNRGAWFELDRKNAKNDFNVYNESNIVLCCYFCNNHKSDVISFEDMRFYFGERMFKFLIKQYKTINHNK